MKDVLSSFILIICLTLVGCSNNNEELSKKEKQTIKVGTSAMLKGVLEASKEGFEKDGQFKLDIEVFDDAIQPNVALQEGSLDANFYQHKPYLESYNLNNKTDLKSYGVEITGSNYGIYSDKIKNLNDLKDNSTVAIPNDATNKAAALNLLQDQGLIKLKDGMETPNVLDIVENNKNLKFIEMERLGLVNALKDVDIGVILADVYFMNNRDPKDALAMDTVDDVKKRGIVLVVRKNQNEEWLKKLEEALKSDEVRKYIEETYKGSKIALF